MNQQAGISPEKTQYGVRKLVLINSGNYGYSEVDLTNSVHLAAPNNRGKSTLVNALQFLYINDIRNMKFANTVIETSKHYFGGSPSYLVFECATPIGLKCLLIRGLSRLQSGKFERYIYDDGFEREDFVDDDHRPREFPDVQELLSGRHFKPVANNALWKVLSGEAAGKGDESGGMKILPIRNQDDYRNFCRVYQKLLTLADLDSDALRELLIACHSRDVGESRIDIATDYRDQFELAEHTEADVEFIESASALIDDGRETRNAIAARTETLTSGLPEVWRRAQDCAYRLCSVDSQLQKQGDELKEKKGVREDEHDALLKIQGAIEERLRNISKEKQAIESQREQWGSYTESILDTMRQNAESLRARVRHLEAELNQSEKYDVRALEQQVKEAEQQIERDRRSVENWEDTFAAFLMKNGFQPEELDTVFRLINTSAHGAIIGDGLEINDEDAVLTRVRALLARTENKRYRDDELTIDLSQHESVDLATLRDPARLRSKIQLASDELVRMKSRLETGKDQQTARDRVLKEEEELKEITTEIQGYDDYAKALERLPELEMSESTAKTELTETQGDLTNIGKAIKDLANELEGVSQRQSQCRNALKETKEQFEKLHAEIRDIGMGTDIIAASIDVEGEVTNDTINAEALIAESTVILTDATSLLEDAKSIVSDKVNLRSLQQEIVSASQQFPGQQVLFADADADWESLVQRVDSIDQLRDTTKQAWDDLFTTLSGRLDGLLLGVKEIQNAVRRLNSSIQSFQVSNLRSVDLKVSTDNSTYQVIAELCSEDGLFQNKDELENAKRHLRNWITDGKEITLDSLFTLRISGMQSDGSPIRASSLDRIGSTGTGITIKAMILINLIRAIAPDSRYHLHFFIDETGRLDDPNLEATTRMAVSQSIIPITAEPKVKLESLAHPLVTVYTLEQGTDKRFRISTRRSFRARRTSDEAPKERPVG